MPLFKNILHDFYQTNNRTDLHQICRVGRTTAVDERNYLRICETDLRHFFSGLSSTGVDDYCTVGLLSLKGRCQDNQFCVSSPQNPDNFPTN